MIKFSKNNILIATLLIFGAMSACSCQKDKPSPRPNIIFIIADTLRPDHMGCYGYDRDTTPRLDEFARDAVVFNRAYCQIPSTLPSHMSIFTGMYPEAHGVMEEDYAVDRKNPEVLNPRISSFPEMLKKAGYYNLGIVSSIWLKPVFGFRRGFDVYKNIKLSLTFAAKINAIAFNWLKTLIEEGRKPFFFFLHYYDPHSDFGMGGRNELPYYAPSPYLERFCRDPLSSIAYKEQLNVSTGNYLGALTQSGIEVAETVRRAIIDLYDAGIAYFDSQLGELFSELKKRGLYDDALIIFISDHGEEFNEHGEFIHNQTYEENIRIPLLIKFPGNKYSGKMVNDPVETVDIMPTILDYLGIAPDSYLQGRSFLDAIRTESETGKLIFSRQKCPPQNRIYSLIDGDYKLISRLKTGERELYDLSSDPEERVNLAERNRARTSRMHQQLTGILQTNRRLAADFSAATDVESLTASEIEKLKSLGYFGN